MEWKILQKLRADVIDVKTRIYFLFDYKIDVLKWNDKNI